MMIQIHQMVDDDVDGWMHGYFLTSPRHCYHMCLHHHLWLLLVVHEIMMVHCDDDMVMMQQKDMMHDEMMMEVHKHVELFDYCYYVAMLENSMYLFVLSGLFGYILHDELHMVLILLVHYMLPLSDDHNQRLAQAHSKRKQ